MLDEAARILAAYKELRDFRLNDVLEVGVLGVWISHRKARYSLEWNYRSFDISNIEILLYRNIELSIYTYRVERVWPSIPWHPPAFYADIILNESFDVSNIEIVSTTRWVRGRAGASLSTRRFCVRESVR